MKYNTLNETACILAFIMMNFLTCRRVRTRSFAITFTESCKSIQNFWPKTELLEVVWTYNKVSLKPH